ncbi:MAG: hypothetical protein Q7K16_04330 [Candidatus Azambacteria bacterium]|nr:hypothetical protein [Candidatus Azambacteria bacterium]
MNKTIVSIIAVAAIVGASSFYGGIKYNQSKNLSSGRGAAALANLSPEERQARIQQFGGGMGGTRGIQGEGFINGEIITSDGKSIIVKLRAGGSKIIFFSDSTEIGKFVAGVAGDLVVGKTVSVTGKANSDGSIAATTVQIRPNMTNPSQVK